MIKYESNVHKAWPYSSGKWAASAHAIEGNHVHGALYNKSCDTKQEAEKLRDHFVECLKRDFPN